MSEIIIANDKGVEQQTPKKEFYVYADEAGISEIRMTNDVAFILTVFATVASFIASRLKGENDQPMTVGKFLSDMGQMTQAAVEQAQARCEAEKAIEEARNQSIN
jgi:hypothetical protein